jgi:hypothetical protein
MLNRSLGQGGTGPAEVTRWPSQVKGVSTRVIQAGPNGEPLVVEISGRGVNGELYTVRTTAEQGHGRVVRLEIDNINALDRVQRDADLARAMKAAGMGDWERNLGHVQPSAAKGAELPYNFEPQAGSWNKAVAGKVNRRTVETQFQRYLDSHPTDILRTQISRNLSKSDALLSERFRIVKPSGEVVFDMEVTTRGTVIDHVAKTQQPAKSSAK